MSTLDTFLRRHTHDSAALFHDGEQPSIEATRFGVEVALRTGTALPIDIPRTLEWLDSLDTGDGFKSTSVDSEPRLSSTYYAVRLFRLLGAASHIEKRRPQLRAFLDSVFARLQDPDVDELYYVLRALQLGGLLDDSAIKPVLIDFFRSCRSAGGGLGNRPGDPGDIEHTYCSLHALLFLGQDIRPLVDREWIQACARPDGMIQWSPDDTKSSFATLYWGSHLGLIADVPLDWRAIREYARSTRNADGGWGPDPSTLWQTYCAASAELIADVALAAKPRAALGIE